MACLSRYLQKYSGLIFLIGLWVLITDLGLASPILLPSLEVVLTKLYTMAMGGKLHPDVLATLMRFFSGLFLGAVLGAFAGLILGVMPKLYSALELPIEFFRSLPVTAIFPLFLMIFGIGDASKIAMAFLPSFLIMLINAAYGVKHAAPERLRMARVFGASPRQCFFQVTLLEALPQIFIGLRLALSTALIVTVVAEMFIGTEKGLGQRIYDSYLTSATPTLYAILIVLGLMGYWLNKIILWIENRFIFWAAR